ncbi:FTR1 family protein [Staphylococcus simiae]|uniref:FTR1 family protein n=1 Tax=Staphylococcus simiae TaxID=308354 RepID=UPI001A97C007|nr:FTR1 family protein [Staphylococcus simiae]MBO1200956.1 FTR1 family protein [Staphylococcus simiae]MBO1203199.1 FTR1 family protein [Staphylococcus simiae]MBO1210693.1 FTR1 family protein [Staphylococcus simiae]MBO1229294.1 FTR1 family protein [Staphylococcus simiae]
MKHYLTKIAMTLMIILMAYSMIPTDGHIVKAQSISDVYSTITDAKSTISDDKASKADKDKAIKQVSTDIDNLKVKDNKQGKAVKKDVKALEKAKSTSQQQDKLSDLTKSLIAYEEKLDSKDASSKIKSLQQQVDAKDKAMQKAIKDKDKNDLESLNTSLNQIWTSNETVIRNYDANQYGQIEVALMQLRVAVQKEPLDTNKVKNAWTTFKSNIDNVDKKQNSKNDSKYKVTQLNDELEKAIKAIDDNNLSQADTALSHFIQIWPYVEGKIQTKDGALYTKIEDKIPYYQSVLDNSNKDRIKGGLEEINSQIKDTVGHSYSFVDVMIIFLREGLEVLLIVMTLTTMTRNVKDTKGTASVISGALVGLILSIALAVVFVQTLGNSGILREGMEAGLGIIAVVLMFVVGIWMHNRSNAKRWNDMIKQMYQNAISNGNLILLATIGLISVLREGVEVIIFYMGMVGELATKDFVIGIALAIVILIIFALLFRFIIKLIPIFYIFRVLSILIFVMAFKMLGVSIQKLQLLGVMPRHGIEGLPTINWLGFYPSVETVLAQVVYVVCIACFVLLKRKK